MESRLFFGFVIDMDSSNPAAREVLESGYYTKAFARAKGLVEPPLEDYCQRRAWYAQVQKLMGRLARIDTYYPDSDDEKQILYVSTDSYGMWREGYRLVTPDPFWDRKAQTAKLREFCDALAIPWQTPEWHLLVYWDDPRNFAGCKPRYFARAT